MPDKDRRKTLDDVGYVEEWSPFGAHAANDPDAPVSHRHYGKYRGVVLNNLDVHGQGRLLVSVPGIVIANWALPCVPVTDIGMGTYVRPRIGANVWVEFEGGDPQRPIWVGGWWGEMQTPLMAKAAAVSVPPTQTVIILETLTSGISVCDTPIAGATVMIKAGAGATTIMLTPGSVSITAPIINLTAPTINISGGLVNLAATTKLTVAAPNLTVV